MARRKRQNATPTPGPASDPSPSTQRQADVDRANALYQEAADLLGFPHPVGAVRWVHIDKVRSNDYNPNAVAHHEMRLLHTSISEDGYTQPVVAIEDDTRPGHYEIVDGFHRYTIMRRFPDVRETTGGYLPVVVIDKPVADRVASTVRHNRARGKHSVAGMSQLVFTMLDEGESDLSICSKLGLEPEELARLKHITGYAKLHADHRFTSPILTERQVKVKAEYKKAHPDEHIPSNF